MNRSRELMNALSALVLGVGLAVGGTAAAHAAQTSPPQVSVTTRPSYEFSFSLLVPNAPVTFTVNGAIVGTGTTDSTGNVRFVFSPEGLAPGYYRLIADAGYPFVSSVSFGVQ